MAIMMSCFAGLAFSVSASEAANNSVTIVTYSFPANNVVGYSTTKVTPGQHWPHAYITSVNFIGVPSNTWPSGAHIKSALFNGTTRVSAWADFTAMNQPKPSEMLGSYSYSTAYRVGGKTTASIGSTITQHWY